MSNETFLIPIVQNNDLSQIALAELRQDLDAHPLNQRFYEDLAYLPGNAKKYSLNCVDFTMSSLFKKRVLFLGSSVTFGFGSLGESIVDYLWKKDGILAIKNAENGTTLVDQNVKGESYVKRFKEELNQEDQPEVFVLQLSTNDATGNNKLGEIADKNYDTQTILGALQYIIAQAKEKWNCPILIYTNPYFKNELYAQMVQGAHELAKKWNVEILDLYNDPDFHDQDSLYMADEIHPTRAGYEIKWLPVFEKKLVEMIK